MTAGELQHPVESALEHRFQAGEHLALGPAEALQVLWAGISAAAFAMMVGLGGGATVTTTVLITPEEADEIVKKTADYRPPGK